MGAKYYYDDGDDPDKREDPNGSGSGTGSGTVGGSAGPGNAPDAESSPAPFGSEKYGVDSNNVRWNGRKGRWELADAETSGEGGRDFLADVDLLNRETDKILAAQAGGSSTSTATTVATKANILPTIAVLVLVLALTLFAIRRVRS